MTAPHTPAPAPDRPVSPRLAAIRLGKNAAAFGALVMGASEEQARWKPDPSQWSILEVLNHLADEEVDDFRRRLELTLFHPGTPWPHIDPPRWAVERAYNERDIAASLLRFMAERERSVDWLAELPEDVDLTASYAHPTAGTLRAGDLLASWVAHDLIHIRQMTRLHYRWLERAAGRGEPPYRLDYAGPF